MSNQTFKLTFDAELKINQLKQSVTAFQQALNGLKMPDKLLSPFTKDLAKLESEIKNFTMLTSKTDFDKSDVNAIVKSYKTIDKLTKSIGITNKELASTNLMNLLPPEALKRFEQLQSILDQINSIDLAKNELANQIADATSKAKDLEDQVRDTEKALNDLRTKQKDNQLNKINATTNRENIEKEIDRLKKANEELVSSRSNNPNVIAANKKIIDDNRKAIQGLLKDIDLLQKTMATQKARAAEAGKSVPAAYYENERKVNREQSDVTRLEAENARLEKENRSMSSQKTDATQLKEYKQREQQIQQLTGQLADAKIAESEYGAAVRKTASDIASTTNTLDKQKQALADVNATIAELQTKDIEASKLQELRQALADILQQDISTIPDNLDDLKNTVSQLQDEPLQKVRDALKQFAQASADASNASEKLKEDVDDGKESFDKLDEQAGDVSALKQRIKYFFGLSNAVNLVKRAIRSAFETIKELDKAMTETAVVTDFSVGDMWEQLPEYTKRANELGVSTLAAYQAATLYYQQGLKTEEVNALSVETLKMARIAGLEAAEATDRMTNALRGFNMELTEANAQRVDDVYSELAANTASNVDEISTAMTKVASLAHNANMEFETTAAFLSQIIETTRESAETAGTALKTVVARFSEVKNLIDTNQLRGQDEEGQVIDVNRVGQALRTAGIDLNKYFLGEVGLDDIFMELASKWDSLTSVQQRYIATQAAGSRQQSRFIALMSDYARTQELVGKAYNANGAAAKQFAKTQESLESKLARLKNAWNEFLMGLTNNQMVKGFVDLLTDLLNTINKITSAFGESGSSIAKWAVAIGALAGGKSLLKQGGFLDKTIGSLAKNSILEPILGKIGIGSSSDKANKDKVPFDLGSFIKSGKTKISDFLQKRRRFKELQETNQLYQDTWGVKNKFGGELQDRALQDLLPNLSKLGKKFGSGAIGKKLIESLGLETLAGGAEGAAAGMAALGTAIAGVSAAAVIAGVAIKALYDASPEGQLASATKLAETIQEIANSAQTASETLSEAARSYKEYNDAVNNATSTQEYNDAIQNRTEYINELIKNNQELAKYTNESWENGKLVLTIDESALNDAIDKASKLASDTTISSNFAQAMKAAKEANVYEERNRPYTETATTAGDVILRNTGKYTKTDEIRQNAITAQQARSEQAKYATAAYMEMLADVNLEDDSKNLLANVLGANFNDETFQKRQKFYAAQTGHLGNGAIKTKYQELFGEIPDELKGNYKAMANAIGNQLASDEQEGLADDLIDVIKNSNGEFLLQVINGTYEESVSNEQLQKAYDALNKAQQESIDKLLGTSGEETYKSLYKFNDDLAKSQKEFRKKTVATLRKSGFSDLNKLDQVVNELSISQDKKLIEIADSLTDFGTQFSDILLQNISTAMLSDEYTGGALESFVADIGNNPVIALKELRKAAEDAQSPLHSLVTELGMIKNNKFDPSDYEVFSKENQVQYFLMSEAYDGLTEQVEEFIKENGAITANNIKDLAKECNTLQALLDNDTISANSLANAINALSTGNVAITDLNNNVLNLYDSFDSVANAIQRAGQFIKDFDPGEDWGDAQEFVDSAVEKMTELVDTRQLGNPQLRNYWHVFFDTDPTDLATWEEGIALIKELSGNGGANFWTQAMGFSMDKNGVIEDMGIDEFKNGDYGSYKDYLKDRAAKNGYSFADDYYDLMIRNMGNHDYGAIKDIAAVELQKISQAYKEALGENQDLVSKEDVLALAEAFHLDPQELLDAAFGEGEIDFNALKEKIRTQFTNLLDLADDAGYELGAGTNESAKQSILKLLGIDDTGSFNIDQLKLKIGELVPEVANGTMSVEDWINEQIANEEGGTVKVPIEYTTYKKNTETGEFEDVTFKAEVEIKNLDDYQKAVDALKKEADSEVLGESLTGAFGSAQEIATSIETIFTNLGSETQLNQVETTISHCKDDADTLNKTLSKPIDKTVNVSAKPSSFTVEGAGDSITFTIKAAAKGGIVKSAAAGTIEPGLALTGEEAPEIVWNKEKGYAYLAGKDGPEINNLQPGDQVFNGEQTRQILKRSGISSFSKGTINSYAGTIWDTTGGKKKKGGGGGGSGSGSGSDKDDEWRNELDWLYNVMENIAELERRQVELQEQYDDLLKDQTATGHDLYKNLIKQMGVLQATLDHQTYTLERREQEMREFMDTTNDEDEYLWYNWEDRTLEIDWDKINEITDQEKYDHITDLIDRAEEIQDKMDDAEDAIQDVKNQIEELENIWRDTFRDFEDRVLDAIVKMYQTVIDNYSELNDTLNESNQAIIDSINKEISLQRQIRDNTKTEQEIADNEARLAYLQRDTTGGNDLAALQMGKELEDQRESYSDNLIDQAIQRLQDDNDAAAQQREKQIEIMQAQLDYQAENGEFNAYIRELMESAIDPDGHLATDSDLYKLLAEQENIDAMTSVQRDVWEEELTGTFKEVVAFLLKEQGEAEGSYFTAVTAAFNSISQTFDKAFHGSTSQGSAHGGSSGGGGNNNNNTTPKHTHVYKYKSDADYYWYECSCGKIKDGKHRKVHYNGGHSVSGCFAPNTEVLMADLSVKLIKDIQVNDIVMSYDECTGNFIEKKVLKSYVHHHTPAMVKIKLENNHSIELTPGHPIYSTNGWKSLDIYNSLYEHHTIASELQLNDIIVGMNGLYKVLSIEQLIIDNNYDSYNIEVEDCHTFIANGIITHNTNKYATGGLNTQTGPAWLDGTPSEPEYVLNARQTDAFLKLADVLPTAMSPQNSGNSTVFGDTTNNIVINVDRIDSDYSVDQMVDRVKEKLFESGSYRNNNVLSLMR